MYGLTPKGVQAKIQLTYEFLQWKMQEHELLVRQIESLREEIQGFDDHDDRPVPQRRSRP